jgi:hypothetical protein
MNRAVRKMGLAAGPMGGSDGAKRTAAIILEVLAGLRTPGEGAEALAISSMRYYVLERRALEGMVGGLEPRPKGKRRRVEDTVAQLTREKTRLERELGRMQALVRAGQRAMRLPPVPSREKSKGDNRRRRRPAVRAVKAVALLRAAGGELAGGAAGLSQPKEVR